MEADKLQLEHTGFDLHRLLAHAVELLKPQAKAKDLDFRLTLEPVLPQYVKGDPYRLRQIVLNLINNAIKFTPSGSIDVKVSGIKGDADGDSFKLYCEIRDTGIGIPQEFQSNLFQEFTMADQGHSRAFEGSGLGLAICKRLVALMGGNISLQSEVGRGSTFYFTVELEAADADEIDRELESNTPRLLPAANTRVLLAEDNPANQAVIKSILEHAGLQVDIVANGREAIDAVRSASYHIVLMDISMPEMDGMDATNGIRQLPGDSGRIPIIALTAHALAGDRERFLAAGMNDYLTKPIDRDATLHAIAHWTGSIVTATAEERALPDLSGTHASETAAAYVDEQVLLQLARDTAPEIVPELLVLYIDDARARLKQIQKAVAEADTQTLEFEAHTLGSSAAAHGNLKLHALARQIEYQCRNADQQQALAKAASLPEVARESFRLLKERVAAGFE